MMIKVEAIVREEKFEDVKAALNEIEVNGITVSQVMGCGAQRGYKEIVRGSEIEIFMQPKIKFEIVVSSEEWEKKTIEAIQKAAYTGEVGDGKIFSYEIRSAMKIRTRETGYDALQSKEQMCIRDSACSLFQRSYCAAKYFLIRPGCLIDNSCRCIFVVSAFDQFC